MTKFTDSGQVVCPRHGLLLVEGKDYRLRKKKRKHQYTIVPACKACDREFYTRKPPKEEDRIRWANERKERVMKSGLKPMSCIHHGLIPVEMVTTQQSCKLCMRDYYQKNKQSLLDAEKARAEKRRLDRKAISKLECPRHGTLTNENINAIGKCLLCRREYGFQYDRKHRERINFRRAKDYWKNRDTLLQQSKEKSKRYVANLTDSIVKGYLRKCGWDPKHVSSKLIELKRATIKIKRIVSKEKGKRTYE